METATATPLAELFGRQDELPQQSSPLKHLPLVLLLLLLQSLLLLQLLLLLPLQLELVLLLQLLHSLLLLLLLLVLLLQRLHLDRRRCHQLQEHDCRHDCHQLQCLSTCCWHLG